jgi:hypothetical protein
MKILLVIPVFFALAAYQFVVNGFVGMMFWHWFIVPIFHLPELTIFQAFGLDLLFSFWTYSYTQHPDAKKHFINVLSMPYFFLATGFFLSYFV